VHSPAAPSALHGSVAQAIDREERYNAQNYQPLPVVLSRGEGVHVWDADGKRYVDFLSGYSSLNQGHRHPKIIKALKDQADKLTLVSRAFYTEELGVYAEFMTKTFGFDRILPMNTGVEGGETSVKMARRWAYDVKGAPANQAVVLFARNNFWGRTLAAVSSSTDSSSYGGFGPFMPGFDIVDYDDPAALERAILRHGPERVAAYMVEPIQGEAGVVVPQAGYMRKVSEICKKYNVLLIADEVQTGLGRTGKLTCCDWDGVKPDLMIFGKALSGGVLPVSCVLGREDVVLSIQRGQHGSTFGGNPLACAVAQASVRVIVEEDLPGRAERAGKIFRDAFSKSVTEDGIVAGVRGRGLLNAVIIRPGHHKETGKALSAWDVCLKLADKGILAKPTRRDIIRFAPPLVISDEILQECIHTIQQTLKESENERRAT
jgi:ornithine--oxo-acid transaminase